ncbi:hypothetical protein E2C01_043718 [Portunus trituberculatus]|uniref:Secreted protein n=1 Tax=Portunus trituberculatus TaxID=210409 RepID=A0A5B7FY23_PORTR|nr:hypothetical protein [Portunus trituberculatus]
MQRSCGAELFLNMVCLVPCCSSSPATRGSVMLDVQAMISSASGRCSCVERLTISLVVFLPACSCHRETPRASVRNAVAVFRPCREGEHEGVAETRRDKA